MDSDPTGQIDDAITPAHYIQAFRGTQNPAIITDNQYRIVDVNDQCVTQFKYSREQLRGELPIKLLTDPRLLEEITDAIEQSGHWNGRCELQTADNRRIYSYGHASELRSRGQVIGHLAVFSDKTRDRLYEQSLSILNRVLRHNIRNDANVVLGHLELLSEELDNEQPESLAIAIDRVNAMVSRAETTRSFSGIFAENVQSALRPIRLDTTVSDAVAQADVSSGHITVDVDPVWVVADQTLTPAITAVIENAIKHNDSDHPCVEITTSVQPGTNAAPDTDRLTLSIADNGPRVSDDRRERIFGREEWTPVHHGQGLSLFFVDRLMDLYGGTVRITDNEPRGSVFKLQFRIPDSI